MNTLQHVVVMAQVELTADRAKEEIKEKAEFARRSLGQGIRQAKVKIAAITNGGYIK